MMSDLYFLNERTQKKYKVVRFDAEAGTVILTGELDAEFEEKFDKAKFKNMGYKPVTI